MSASLVGSEMCIRDRGCRENAQTRRGGATEVLGIKIRGEPGWGREGETAVSYTHLTLPTICSV
eukprot:12277155-Alexandrium_andersonii.AAC.1